VLILFLKYIFKNNKNLNIYIDETNLYYTTLHLKLSTLFYSIQLCEILSYEIPLINNNDKKNITNSSIIIYNFHSILNQQRIFLTSVPNVKKIIKNSLIF